MSMEENSFIKKIIEKRSTYEQDIIFDRFEEVSQPIYEKIPDYNLQAIPKESPEHFYLDGEEVSEDVYERFERIKEIGDEARQLALDGAMLQILRDLGFISDSSEEKPAHSDLIPEDPYLIPEISRFLKDNKENNEKRMEYFDYIIEVLKDGPKSSREVEKRICKSHKVCGHSAYYLLDKLEYYAVIYKRHEAKSVKLMYRLTPFWEIMYSAMKK